MFQLTSSGKGAVTIAMIAIVSHAGYAHATDLVGRNGTFTITEKNGATETVDSKSLSMPKELLPSAPRASAATASNLTKGTDKPGAPPPTGKTVAVPKPAAPKEETPEEKATRAKDVETLRELRKLGGAYFYTTDNKPVSNEEIDRRIESGEVEGLKVIGLQLQDWQPETKSKDAPAVDSATASAPQNTTPPILVPRLPERKKY